MADKLNKNTVKKLVLATKYIPMLIAIIYFLNTTISFFYGNDISLNYIGGMSFLPLVYLYLASYTFKLCEYYRMYLHYIVIITLINVYDYYFGININDINYYLLIVLVTIIILFIIIYLKFFK